MKLSITVNEPRQPEGWRFASGELPKRTRSRIARRPRAGSIRKRKLRNKYCMTKFRLSFHFKTGDGSVPEVHFDNGALSFGAGGKTTFFTHGWSCDARL